MHERAHRRTRPHAHTHTRTRACSYSCAGYFICIYATCIISTCPSSCAPLSAALHTRCALNEGCRHLALAPHCHEHPSARQAACRVCAERWQSSRCAAVVWCGVQVHQLRRRPAGARADVLDHLGSAPRRQVLVSRARACAA